MNIYRVLVNGENFLMTVDGKPEKLGFYTTRFVEASNETEAETAAVSALRQDEQLQGTVLNIADDPPLLYADEIEQVSALEKAQGFAFYPSEA